MKTLIVPCGGRSSRYPNMRPKWLLTHPDGQLMIEKNLQAIDPASFDRIIITIVAAHDEKYQASLILNQALKEKYNVEICIIPNFTQGPAETVLNTLTQMRVEGPFVVKDSDNAVSFNKGSESDYVVCFDISKNQDIKRIGSKSFLEINEQNLISNIIEKKIISKHICVGVYAFSSPQLFRKTFEKLNSLNSSNQEIYLSHIISSLIGDRSSVFHPIEALTFEDWGTLEDWKVVQKKHSTYFVDIDGVIVKNKGKYGLENWSNYMEPITENLEKLSNLVKDGAQIIFVTSRPEEFLPPIRQLLTKYNLNNCQIVSNLNHAPRILINDFAPSNPYPSASAISIPRDCDLASYL